MDSQSATDSYTTNEHKCNDTYNIRDVNDVNSIPSISLDADVETPGKYKSTITNILSKHCSEVKTASESVVQPILSVSKKKLKELVNKHDKDLLSFMIRHDKSPNSIGAAETIFKRYGYDTPLIKGNRANTVLKDLNLDVSTDKVVAEFDTKMRESYKISNDNRTTGVGIRDFITTTQWIYAEYKNIGEQIHSLESVLYKKIDTLDKINNKANIVSGLTDNDALPDLLSSFTTYLDTVYKSTNLEKTYTELIEAYKKWNICRQIITPNIILKNDTRVPTCIICVSEPVAIVNIPCGHTFCGTCVKHYNDTCFTCRSIVRDKIKMYFS
jgi:hypothetical protein